MKILDKFKLWLMMELRLLEIRMRSKEDKLEHACMDGDLKEVKRLIKAGANIHVCNESPLVWARMSGHVEVEKYLLLVMKMRELEV